MAKKINCWIITEGLAGTENQCLGVTEALDITPTVFRIQLAWPWNFLSPYLGFECAATFKPRFTPPWPDLLVTSGRKAIAAGRYIKKQSKGKTVTVHLQDPRISPKAFDLVALPAHDPTRGDNVIVTTAAPNKIHPQKLEHVKTDFPVFSNFNTPRIAVLIGGNSKAYTLTPEIMDTLATQLLELKQNENASLMITTSRRTGKQNEEILKTKLQNTDAYIWDGTDKNPYFAMLAYADYILVTADSTSMLSEAATTGKPVYRIDLQAGKPHKRIAQMHENLEKTGAIRPFKGILDPPWTYTPLNDADLVAQMIKKKFFA